MIRAMQVLSKTDLLSKVSLISVNEALAILGTALTSSLFIQFSHHGISKYDSSVFTLFFYSWLSSNAIFFTYKYRANIHKTYQYLSEKELLLFSSMLSLFFVLSVSNHHAISSGYGACLVLATLFHPTQFNLIPKIFKQLIRWRPIRATEQSEWYYMSIHPAKIVAAILLYSAMAPDYMLPAQSLGLTSIGMLPINTVYYWLISCVPLLAAGLYTGHLALDQRSSSLDTVDKAAFLVKQLVVTSTESIIHINMLLAAKSIKLSRIHNICSGAVIAALGVSCLGDIKLPLGEHSEILTYLIGIALFAYIGFDEIAPAILFGFMHEKDSAVMIALATVAGLAYNKSYQQNGWLISPILTHMAVNCSHFFGIYSPFPDSLKSYVSREIPDHIIVTYPKKANNKDAPSLSHKDECTLFDHFVKSPVHKNLVSPQLLQQAIRYTSDNEHKKNK